ncbi:NB-ARC domain-containing protein [Herpetosiphon gulosus]|uniref:Orc1-like AAA ATPase domain-containing protein n=1 Tax=Herpetosiphon gulosus TaxID=1973496 RepID=A0ABP9WZD2_9CHLR
MHQPDPETLQRAYAQFAKLPLKRIPKRQQPAPESWLPLHPANTFIGREFYLRQLAQAMASRDATESTPAVVITGMGGMGKTSLALEFAHRYGHYFAGGVFWINADDTNSVRCIVLPSLDAIWRKIYHARDLKLAEWEQRLTEVQAFFNNPIPRLLIFDNCENEALLEMYRPSPSSGCRILVTSRNSTWSASNIHQLPLDVLEPRESCGLLQRLVPRLNLAEAAQLAEAVSYLPLALYLVGYALGKLEPTLAPIRYLERLQQALLDELELNAQDLAEIEYRSATNYQSIIAATVWINYDLLVKAKTGGDLLKLRRLLSLLACCAPNLPIPLSALGFATGFSQRMLNRLLRQLARAGFIQASDQPQIHGLIAVVIRSLEHEQLGVATAAMNHGLIKASKIACEEWAMQTLSELEPHLYHRYYHEGERPIYAGQLLNQLALIASRRGD